MSGRTKPMADAIVWDELAEGAIFIDYQPGDCTRYVCRIAMLDLSSRALMSLGFAGHEPAGVFLFTWINRGRGGVCCVLRNDGFLHAGYLGEKLGVNMASSSVLAELIAHYTNRTADSTAFEAPVDATEPRPCGACDGTGGRLGNDEWHRCSECDGEGVARLSR